MPIIGKNKPLDPLKDEQYTPKFIFDALKVTFDLDVSAPIDHTDHVPAYRRLTIREDGLQSSWQGLVWMNPPYSKAAPWVAKFLSHGNGIALLPFSKAYWMVELWNKADAICPVYDIKFEQQQGKAKGIFMPVALFGIGEIGARAVSNCKLNRVR